MCGYTCCNCGRCKGSGAKPRGYCIFCRFQNDAGARVCASCGAELPPPPGTARKKAADSKR